MPLVTVAPPEPYSGCVIAVISKKAERRDDGVLRSRSESLQGSCNPMSKKLFLVYGVTFGGCVLSVISEACNGTCLQLNCLTLAQRDSILFTYSLSPQELQVRTEI